MKKFGSYVVPREVGRFILLASDVNDEKGSESITDLIPCNQTLGVLTESISEDDQGELSMAMCVDPN